MGTLHLGSFVSDLNPDARSLSTLNTHHPPPILPAAPFFHQNRWPPMLKAAGGAVNPTTGGFGEWSVIFLVFRGADY